MPKPFIHPDDITEQMFAALDADITHMRNAVGFFVRAGGEVNANMQTLIKGGDVPTVFDGKKVKRKEITVGALPNNTTKQVLHNISGIGTVVACRGYAYDSTAVRWINVPQ